MLDINLVDDMGDAPMDIVADQTRRAVWENVLDAEKNFRYFGALADQYSNRAKWMRVALLGSVLIEGAVLIPNASNALGIAFTILMGVVIAGLVAWDAISDYGKTAAGLRSVHADTNMLRNEWAHLWRDIETYAISEAEARRRLRDLENMEIFIFGKVDVPLNESYNDSCEEEAFRVVQEQYAIS